MSEQENRPNYPQWKIFLTAIVGVFWVINQLIMDKETMKALSGASETELNYWGTKAAGFALIAAVALFVTLIPAQNRWVNLLTHVVGGLAAVFSGFYWLQESTSGKAGGYIGMIVLAVAFILVAVLTGPIIATIRERRAKNQT